MFKNTPLKREPARSTHQEKSAWVLFAVMALHIMQALRALVTGVFLYTRERLGASLAVALMLTVMLPLFVAGWMAQPESAWAATGNTLNFQARLQSSAGSISADGNYNLQFKLYDAASGGTALWTESYLVSGGKGIPTKNGYLSTSLGSVTPFPSTINWGQQLYITMNVGGTESTPDWDGEMNPRLSLTSVPSAFSINSHNSATGYTGSLKVEQMTSGNQTFVVPDQGSAGAYTLLTTQAASSAFIQNTTSAQSGASFNVGGTGQIGGALTVGGMTTLTGGLTVSGPISLGDGLAVTNGVSITNVEGTALQVTGSLGQNVVDFVSAGGGTVSVNDAGWLVFADGMGNAMGITPNEIQSSSFLNFNIGGALALNSYGALNIQSSADENGNNDNVNINTQSGNSSTYIGSDAGSGGIYLNAGSAGLNVAGSSETALLSFQNTGSAADILLSSGILRNASESTSALTIQSSNGDETLFSADTTNNRIIVGNATGSGNDTTTLVLDGGATDPTGTNGAMYYNSANDVFRCYSGGSWKNCTGTGDGGDLQIGSATSDGTQINLQLDSSNNYADTGSCNSTSNQGAMYYNTATASLRSCSGGGWTDLVTVNGLGLLGFGVMPDSGTNPGDIASTAATNTSGPCKVSWASSTSVDVSACTAYSGGRKLHIAATTIGGLSSGSSWYHIYLNPSSGAAVASSAQGSENAGLPAWSANAPIVMLADIQVDGGGAISGIYDTRVFTTSIKTFATANAAIAVGDIVKQSSTSGQVELTSATSDGNLRGVVVASSGSASSSSPNLIIVVGGPAFVKTIGSAATVNSVVSPSGTAGYATGGSNVTLYGNLGVGQLNVSGACSAANNCQYSQLLEVNIR